MRLKISIRRRIIITFVVFMVISGVVWSLGYYRYYLLNRKLELIESKDRLLNTVLEIRRYEKNYFLNLDTKDLRETLDYTEIAGQQVRAIIQHYAKYALTPNLESLEDNLNTYRRLMKSMLESHEISGALKLEHDILAALPGRMERVRVLGKEITDEVESMVARERRYVAELVQSSETYLIFALCAIIGVSLATALFLIFNINRPLKALGMAIKKLSERDYRNIPPISTGDEFEHLVTSINEMLQELHRRSEQLIQSEKVASLGTLTSGVAHELNNPLNNISTSVQILLEELGEGDLDYQKELLAETEKQVERARDIVKALLEFSRQRSFSLKEVRFADLVEQTLKLIRGEIPSHIHLQVEVPEDIKADMDPRRIQQVLLNLILNAFQAMEDQGTMRIKASRTGDGREFWFDIEDNGKGIDPHDLPKIFDPFFTTKEVGKGSGLGLSVSQGIVEQHGGRIEVRSEVGKGTTFRVYLPLRADAALISNWSKPEELSYG
ncbi:MAG: ATP-binding protein [Desulfobacteraceae bacterium]